MGGADWRGGGEDATPLGWWGPFRRPAVTRSVVDLVRTGVLDPELAGLLWAAVARRASLTVVAAPSGAGKTTVLTALLELLPAGVRRLYVRGRYEPFAFLAEAGIDPGRTALLVNEISPHLPIYLWGPGVRRLLDAARSGYAVYATAHAASARELVGSLAGYPLRVPTAEIAALGLVLALDAWEAGGQVQRRARELAALRATPSGGVAVTTLARRERDARASVVDAVVAAAVIVPDGADADRVRVEVAARADLIRGLAKAAEPPPEGIVAALASAAAAAGIEPPN